jgi:hypothetical protein
MAIPADARELKLRYDGTCSACGAPQPRGTGGFWSKCRLPYPRSPNAEEALKAAGVLSEEQAGPFAALAKLTGRVNVPTFPATTVWFAPALARGGWFTMTHPDWMSDLPPEAASGPFWTARACPQMLC